MGLLEKLGLGQKKRHGAPVIGEKKKQREESSSLRYNNYVRALILLGFLVLLVVSIPQSSFRDSTNYAIGEPWRGEDLTAPFDFAINKTQQEIEQERQAIRQSTPPIFHRNTGAASDLQSRIDSVFRRMEPVLERYHTWRETDRQQDSLQFVQARDASGLGLSDSSWRPLLENYHRVVSPDLTPNTRSAPADAFIGNELRQRMQSLMDELLEDGVINIAKSEISTNEITVRNLQDRTERTLNLGNVRDLQEARSYAGDRFSRFYYEDIARAANDIFARVLQPNLVYNTEETNTRIEEAIANISTTRGAVTEGEVIIRRGDIITQERYSRLQSLAEARSRTATTMERWLRYGGEILAVVAIITIFFFYLYLYRRSIFEDNSMLLLVTIAMGLICVGSSIAYSIEGISAYIVPVAVAPIILTIIFDSRVGLISTITLALLTGLINGNNFEYVTATTVACSLGLFSVRDIKKRSQFFFTTPGIVFASYTLVILSFSMTSFQGWDALLDILFYVGINAIFILFTYPLILLFEKAFKVTTDFTLLELSDTNLPMLKELMTRAPGTFHHSLQVSNMAEAAAGSIGANGLLCRVGALYHDIGKMENPGYYSENQVGTNEHDKLKPRMSALVIKAHVSNGVKMAREHGLPEVIIDFIKTHHGTSLIKYFYDKGKKNADQEKDEIREEDFRYDGPLPRTKETGILLLADGIEAASRAMKDPNYQKLESLISKMIDERVYEGQLSMTPLTFQDLRNIRETFLNILMGIYHSRVEYPDDKKEEKEQKDGSGRIRGRKEGPAVEKAPLGEETQQDGEGPQVNEYYNS
ncbi:MAG: HDIG domain-containing protein [Balneolaceae bacterium]|nr:HDIG domain-containing protein [Balneolaceae bacterium]